MIKLHYGQSDVLRSLFVQRKHRFACVCCSRGWGKSYGAASAAVTAAYELMALPANVPNKNVFIIGPTHDQVTDIYYPILNYDYGLEDQVVKPASKDLGRFFLPGNVELRLLSYEAVERMRGKGAYFVVWDEVSSCTKGIKPKSAWEGIIQPCLVTRWSPQNAARFGAKSPGRMLAISTPKGYNFFHEMHTYQEKDALWKSWHFDYTKSPFLDPVEIERLRNTLDPIEFASEYLADFKESGNSVFYCFDRKKHVDSTLPYFEPPRDGNKGEDVHVTIDFNVGLQCTSAMAIRGSEVHILDEFKGHPDTETLAIALSTKYKGHKITAYPDPSGRARKSSAPVGVTDFSILESHGIRCLARPAAPPIVDSVAAVNAKLMNAAGRISAKIHPRCEGGVRSLERTKWVDKNPDTATIDKTEGVEHFSDGFRYGFEYLFPVRSGTKQVARGFGF